MKKVLQRTSLEAGNIIAWVALAAALGFAAGWVANAEFWRGFCFPPV